MKKALIISGLFIIASTFYFSQTERDLELTFVNATSQEQIEIEYNIDEGPVISMVLEKSLIPIEWIQKKVSFGQHRLNVKSKDCNVNMSIEFFNFKRVEINLEFQSNKREICETLVRKSMFKLMYQ